MPRNGFTPTQQAMLDVLADGLPHQRKQLEDCLPDELGRSTNIHRHLSAIRRVLRPQGQDIVCCVVNRRNCYRRIRLLSGNT